MAKDYETSYSSGTEVRRVEFEICGLGWNIKLVNNDDGSEVTLRCQGKLVETWEYETQGRAKAEFDLARTILRHVEKRGW